MIGGRDMNPEERKESFIYKGPDRRLVKDRRKEERRKNERRKRERRKSRPS